MVLIFAGWYRASQNAVKGTSENAPHASSQISIPRTVHKGKREGEAYSRLAFPHSFL